MGIGQLQGADVLVTAILGGVGILVSWAVYRQTEQSATDTWLRTFADIHKSFWDDDDIREVRKWLAYPALYERELKSVLVRRMADPGVLGSFDGFDESDYAVLDRLDKYLNTILRAITLDPEVQRHRDLWNALHFKYWLNVCLDGSRPELLAYVKKFYGDVWAFGNTERARAAGVTLGFDRPLPAAGGGKRP